MILNDLEIQDLCMNGMIEPFYTIQIEDGVISYGLGSFGYDIRLGNQFQVFHNANQTVIDPKNFDENVMVEQVVNDYVQIPPNSFILGHSYERFDMPKDVLGLCVGKSTYARCGIIVNITPLEPGWEGYLTIEISNTTPEPARVYAEEGIAQVLFFKGEQPLKTYKDKEGKYQDQVKEVTTARVVS